MNRQRGPEPELRLREMQPCADQRKHQQSDRVQYKDGAERD